jgi:hypothetical protein
MFLTPLGLVTRSGYIPDLCVVVVSKSAGLRYPRVLSSRVPLYQAMYSMIARHAVARVGQTLVSVSSLLAEAKGSLQLQSEWKIIPRGRSRAAVLARSLHPDGLATLAAFWPPKDAQRRQLLRTSE